MSDVRKALVVNAVWRRRKTGALLRITSLRDHSSSWNPETYFDVSWETVEKPVRRGQSYEDYWLRNCEPAPALPAEDAGAGSEA